MTATRSRLGLTPTAIAAAVGVLLVLAFGYWFWFRDSSFARVKDVYVTGVDGPQARQIRKALEDAAVNQTTLHVQTKALREAVATYPVVRSVTAQGDFPHKLTIAVNLNLPVAVLQSPTGRKPVAGDGLLLPDVPVTGGLPVIRTQSALPTERVTAGRAFDLVRVVGLAPAPLRRRIEDVSFRAGTEIVVQLDKGPELRFGDASRLPAKWVAAARVLAASGARGATYIDLRLPERPAAGGLPTTTVIPLAPAGETAPAPAPTTPVTATQTATAATPNPQLQVETSTQPSTTP